MDLHDTMAEEYILGACLLNNRTIDMVMETITHIDFYRASNQHIFKTMMLMNGQRVPIDLITLTNSLRTDKLLDLIGGAPYISSLTDESPTSANIKYYCDIVRRFSQLRRLFDIGKFLIDSVQDLSADVDSIKTNIEKTLLEMEGKETSGYKHIREHIVPTIEGIEYDFKYKGEIKGVPTGIYDLDQLTCGWQDGNYIIVGARPSVGKTATALQMIINAAVESGVPTGFFSAEMAAIPILRRMIGNIGMINSHSMRNGMLKTSDFASIQDAASMLYSANIFINDTPNIFINDLVSESRRMVRQEKVKIIFIDYIGLISHTNKKLPLWERVGEISKTLKGLARELNIPFVVLSQLSRDTEGKEPTLATIRGSGDIEQDADAVLFLHRDKETNESEIDIKFILAKQRDGPIGKFMMTHQAMYGRMIGRKE